MEILTAYNFNHAAKISVRTIPIKNILIFASNYRSYLKNSNFITLRTDTEVMNLQSMNLEARFQRAKKQADPAKI